jgi:preflagellin peptidase FlaK
VFEFATVPDVLRLLVVPVFGYLAWQDIETRRVPNRTWYPLAALAVLLLAWETYTLLTGDVVSFRRRRFFIRTAISVGFLIPLSYVFWLMGGFGGADAKAFMIVALLFPTYPVYELGVFGAGGPLAELPVVGTEVGVFSLTILSNTVLLGALYPVALAGRNAVSGYVSPGMFVAKPIPWERATEEYGTMLEFPDRGLTDDLSPSGFRSYFTWRSLDLDALRMYLRWRGCTLAELRDDPDAFRDPASLPDEPNPPGDGSLATDGGTPADGTGPEECDDPDASDPGREDAEDEQYDDPWGAEAFLDDIEGSAYGTSPAVLRAGLETLADDDVIWISPGIPFLVPLFVGLVVAFTYGDLLFAFLGLVGLV